MVAPNAVVNGVHGVVTGGEANSTPPSTIAAQLVEHHSTAATVNQPQGRETFRQLLEEIRVSPENVGADQQVIHQLISVVANAGLDALVKGDPFAAQDDTISQAITCLDVIEIAFKRAPEVILPAEQDEEQARDQLCLLLFPRLFAILSHFQSDALREHVERLLSSILASLQSDPEHWKRLPVLVQLYQNCIEDVLASFDNSILQGRSIHDNIDLQLPSSSTIAALCHTTQQPIALKGGNQCNIRSVSHALVVVSTLVSATLSLFSVRLIEPTSRNNLVGSTQHFAVSTLARITKSSLSIRATERKSQSASIVVATSFLQDVKTIALLSVSDTSCTVSNRKVSALLVSCLQQLLSWPAEFLTPAIQRMFAHVSMLFIGLSIKSTYAFEDGKRKLGSGLAAICEDASKLEVLSADLHNSIRVSMLFLFPKVANQSNLAAEFKVSELIFSDTLLRTTFETVDIQSYLDMEESREPPSKRRKSSDRASSRTYSYMSATPLEELCLLLGKWDSSNLTGLGEAMEGLFQDLSNEEKSKAIKLIAILPCRGNLQSARLQKLALSGVGCDHCDRDEPTNRSTRSSLWDLKYWNWFSEILGNLLRSKELQFSRDQKTLLVVAVKRFLCHTPVTGHLDLTRSELGKFCLQSLRSSHREVRLAAVQVIPDLLQSSDSMDAKVYRQNRVIALDFLRQLSEAPEARYSEVVILALGQVASACGDEELNLVLLRLIDYLGHTNSLICGLAHVELRRLASATLSAPEELLRPFWRTIAITVFKDLQNRPQKAQQLADFLGFSVNQLLLHTQTEIIPYLVLWKRKDILQRMATARGDGTTIWSLCMQHRNLAAILSNLISQNATETEGAISSVLAHIASEFKHEDVSNLLKVDPISVACDILKLAGDEESDGKRRIVDGFRNFVLIVERKGQGTKHAITQTRAMAVFFETHALGMMTAFSDVVDNPNQPSLEKKRSLRGLDQMILIAGDHVAFAVPQIRACLQSALESSDLRDVAFSAWVSLLSSLKIEEELEALISPTFAAIVQYWDTFASTTQERAYNGIATLLKDHSSLIQDNVLSIPTLTSIPMMSKIESQLSRLRKELDTDQHLQAFAKRSRDENAAVVLQALRELLPFLNVHQQWIHESALDEQPAPVLADLSRALLDTCVRYNEDRIEIAHLSSQCLGVLGCLDPNRMETIREKRDLVALSNFSQASEAVLFVAFLLENVLVKAFNSVSNPRAQGFLAYAMQELLKFCGFNKEATRPFRPQGSQADETHQRWQQLSESTRNTLTPFLTSRYVLNTQSSRGPSRQTYPIYNLQLSHGTWLRDFVYDLLQRAKGDNAQMIFSVLSRIIRGYDVSIASSLLPFAAANVIITGEEIDAKDVETEILTILEYTILDKSPGEMETIKLCSENVFQLLDYLSRWLQAMKRKILSTRSEREQKQGQAQVERVESLLLSIPADVISQRAVECGSYARALYHWEDYIREVKSNCVSEERESLYTRLRNIYAQIDEPDGIEGISSHLSVLSPEQQVLEHRRAGRWAAAQSWYELQLQNTSDDLDTHLSLMACLQEAGQYNVLIEHAKMPALASKLTPKCCSLVSEAAWRTNRWEELEQMLDLFPQHISNDFNVGLGAALVALRKNDTAAFTSVVHVIRTNVAKSFSPSSTVSLQACHPQLLRLHALSEVELIAKGVDGEGLNPIQLHAALSRRLAVLGSNLSDKQFLLGLRRATMSVAPGFNSREIAASWIVTAQLARKAGQRSQAYDAILHASQLGDDGSKMEQARLLWSDGEHRKAIHCLQSAIDAKMFSSADVGTYPDLNSASMSTSASSRNDKRDLQNLIEAKALLLLAKWLDRAGQTQTKTINEKYQAAAACYSKWEKGFYYLGRYYNKLLDSEKSLPIDKQSARCLAGETAKLAIENYLRSLVFGCKYIFETLPKSLTLWLDFGAEVSNPVSRQAQEDVRVRVAEQRPKMLDIMNKQVKKYSGRMPTYLLYISLAQLLTRICHSNDDVYGVVAHLLVQIGTAYPQQSLWSMLATMKSSTPDRSKKGANILLKVKEAKAKISRNEGQSIDMRTLVLQGQKLVDNLLQACEANVDGRPTLVSLSKDLGFSHKVAPCALVVPTQQTLSANLPTVHDSIHMKSHKAFPQARDAVTIAQFNDDVMVLNSLQKPRKLTVRGSDGNKYGLLCKPNDDLRKDQRLMEFNAMINRGLRKDAEASKRRLHIKTYAVTPLNEACGLIEWVDGLKPMRDILLKLYRSKGVAVDYNLLRNMLDEACNIPDPRIFSETIVNMYPPILHEWFTDLFPEPESWFAARLRYTRSCAVTSIVGYALGLGDRHGENVLLEENSGGVFHVDFNCLFDRGLTFEKPELVPFRLTHNMVDAFGAYNVEGPFRRSAECTMSVMRGQEDALLTILETFVYDPTADFVRPRKRTVKGVPETPREVLESVRSKLRGLFKGESVPLGVEGHVDALIRQATDPANLCAMYIGWCAFL